MQHKEIYKGMQDEFKKTRSGLYSYATARSALSHFLVSFDKLESTIRVVHKITFAIKWLPYLIN